MTKLKRQVGVWCPECGAPVVKAGWQKTNRKGDRRQMHVCTQCGRRTVNPRRVE